MERTRNLKSGLKAAAVAVFFAAALLSTGCSNNALMNPQISSANSGQAAHAGSQPPNPGSQPPNP